MEKFRWSVRAGALEVGVAESARLLMIRVIARQPRRITSVRTEEKEAPSKASGAARRWLATATVFQPEAREVSIWEVSDASGGLRATHTKPTRVTRARSLNLVHDEVSLRTTSPRRIEHRWYSR